MKIILLFLCCFLAGISSGTAQQSCSGDLQSSPALLGLRLNMSPEQAQGVFGRNLKISFKTKGEKTIFENYINKTPPPALAGVRAVYLRFFDRKLYQIEVFYEERNDWQTLEAFTAALSAKLEISPARWTTALGKSEIICQDFSVVAHKTLNPRIEITDETIRAQVEELREREKNKN